MITDSFITKTNINCSGGPLPEHLLGEVACPVRILWGERDPWEPIEEGRTMFSSFPCVDSFISLPGNMIYFSSITPKYSYFRLNFFFRWRTLPHGSDS